MAVSSPLGRRQTVAALLTLTVVTGPRPSWLPW
jgi:hypothetical protein